MDTPGRSAGAVLGLVALLGVLTVVNHEPPKRMGWSQQLPPLRTTAVRASDGSSGLGGGSRGHAAPDLVLTPSDAHGGCPSTLPNEVTDPLQPLSTRLMSHARVGWRNLSGTEAALLLRPDELPIIGTTPTPSKTDKLKCKHPSHPILYAGIGNQCGCGSRSFTAGPLNLPHHAQRDVRPAARLVSALRGRTLCVVGDSVDLQLVTSIWYGIERVADVAGCRGMFGGVKFSDKASSCTIDKLITWWGMFKGMPEMEVRTPDNSSILGRVRYIKVYANDAAIFPVVERYCDVVSMNYGAHWAHGPGSWKGRDPKSMFPLAVEAAVGFLTNLSDSGKVAIWRGGSAQHFKPKGVFAGRDKSKNATCVPYNPECDQDEQPYNTVVRRVFDRMAWGEPPLRADTAASVKSWDALAASPCSKTTARVSEKSEGLPSAYDLTVKHSHGYVEGRLGWWQHHNFTETAAREATRVSKGRVYWWPIFDLFNPFWAFHAGDSDCTHYCYILGPFDAAIERLTVVLTAADRDRGGPQPSTAKDNWEC